MTELISQIRERVRELNEHQHAYYNLNSPVSDLAKVSLKTPLLSLDKTKQLKELLTFIGNRDALLMFKLEDLTMELDYENGSLIRACTHGDGYVGEDITHNIPAFLNVPQTIPYKRTLRISGEAVIFKDEIRFHGTDPSGNAGRM